MDRLESFEAMLAHIQTQYADTVARLADLRAQGKEKTVTYRQLLTDKLRCQDMLSLYALYGLTEPETKE